MTALSHTQARHFILAAADDLLASSDQELLAEHLQNCAECQGYQAELNALEAQIQAACQEHRETAPSLQRTWVPNLQTQHRRNAMNARLASTLKFAIGSALLAGLVILVVTSLLNAKKIQGTPTPQPAQQTPVLNAKSTPTLETTTHPEIDLSTGQQNGEWVAFIASPENIRSTLTEMDVYLIHPDGSSITNLTNKPGSYSHLAWSPNGEKLAFLRQNADRADLTVIDMTSKQAKTLANPATANPDQADVPFRWSPNGQQIVFRDKINGNYAIFTINSDSSEPKQLSMAPRQETAPLWSPDGNQIAYLSYETTLNEGKFSVHVMNADGSNNVEVAQGSGQAKLQWATDGNSIYATTDFRESWLDCAGCLTTPSVYLINIDGTPVRQLFHARDSGGEAGIGPVLSDLYIDSENTVYFKQITLTNGRTAWMRIVGSTAQGIGDLDARAVCPSNANGYSEDYLSPNKMFSLVSIPCVGKFNLYLADRQATSPDKFLRPLITLPEGTKGLGGDLTWLPTVWSPDGRWVVIQTEGTGEYGTVVQALNVEAALQDPAAQPSLLLQSKSMLAEIDWQPGPAENPHSDTAANRLAAFASNQDGNSEIYVTRTDGGGAVNLTNNAAYDGNPIWSPDGMRLAFESERDGNREIYVMNLDGSGITRLTNNPTNDVLTTAQAWSPDGKHLLYRNDRQGKWDLFAAQTDGSGVVQLTEDSDPAADDLFYWSPNGQKVAYEVGWTAKNKPQVYVINTDGTNRQQLPTPQVAWGFSLYNWAADGQALYYNASDCVPNTYGDCASSLASLYRVALDGSDPVLLASAPQVLNWIISPSGIFYFDANMPPLPTNRIGYDHWIWWQTENGNPKKLNEWPDLQEKCQNRDIDNFQVERNNYAEWPETEKHKLVAVYCGKDNQSWLYLANADGSRIQPLNNTAIPGRADNLRISADEQLALLDIFDASEKATYALDLVAAQNNPTLSPIRLTGDDLRIQPIPFDGLPSPRPVPTPIASPTVQSAPPSSRQDLIVFASDNELFVMQKDGKDLRQLTKGQFSYTYGPLWSPNGKQITFGVEDKDNNYWQYLINLDGSGLTRMTVGGWKTIWSPDGSQLATIFGDVQKPAEGKIEIVNVDGSQRRTIQLENIVGEPDPGHPIMQWSSDGKFVQFLAVKFSGGIPYSSSDQWTIYQVNTQDGSLETLVESKVPIASWYGTATDLTYVTADQDKNEWQWIHNQTVLTTLSQGIFDPDFNCQWSPDHHQLVCTMRENYGKETFQLLLINADDFSIKSIAQNLSFNGIMISPSWSPDGRYLVFHSSLESPGNTDIYRLDVQAALNDPSTKPVRLTTAGFNETLPDWQP